MWARGRVISNHMSWSATETCCLPQLCSSEVPHFLCGKALEVGYPLHSISGCGICNPPHFKSSKQSNEEHTCPLFLVVQNKNSSPLRHPYGNNKGWKESNSCPISVADLQSPHLDCKKAVIESCWGLFWVWIWQPQGEQLPPLALEVAQRCRKHEASHHMDSCSPMV